jgi:hypothetical protein
MPMYDYANAAKLFGMNNFARAPKYKVLFFVRFILNVGDNTELSYAVKSAELPKFELDVQDVNQYNKKVIVQRQVKYTPVTIKFHDDNNGTLRKFWQKFYQYYFDDGTHDDNDYKPSDLYEDSRTNSNWGFSGKNQEAYINTIEIYDTTPSNSSIENSLSNMSSLILIVVLKILIKLILFFL